jgi:hypothetical protein
MAAKIPGSLPAHNRNNSTQEKGGDASSPFHYYSS